jgi:hypothetical protein
MGSSLWGSFKCTGTKKGVRRAEFLSLLPPFPPVQKSNSRGGDPYRPRKRGSAPRVVTRIVLNSSASVQNSGLTIGRSLDTV